MQTTNKFIFYMRVKSWRIRFKIQFCGVRRFQFDRVTVKYALKLLSRVNKDF